MGPLDQLIEDYDNSEHSNGVCCCGDNIDQHGDPMCCGHSPVDSGDYYAGLLVTDAKCELRGLRAKYLEARLLLKSAGDLLEVQGNQKARAIRFKILNFMKGEDNE